MTVKDLIFVLKQLPQDLEIVCGTEYINGCYINHEYSNKDNTDSKDNVVDVVRLI